MLVIRGAGKTLTRLAALATLSRSAGEGLKPPQPQSPFPALRERGDQARQRLVGEGVGASRGIFLGGGIKPEGLGG
jgi:hypothetical protein